MGQANLDVSHAIHPRRSAMTATDTTVGFQTVPLDSTLRSAALFSRQ